MAVVDAEGRELPQLGITLPLHASSAILLSALMRRFDVPVGRRWAYRSHAEFPVPCTSMAVDAALQLVK